MSIFKNAPTYTLATPMDDYFVLSTDLESILEDAPSQVPGEKNAFDENLQWFAYTIDEMYYEDGKPMLTCLCKVFSDEDDELIDGLPRNWAANRDRLTKI